MRLLNVHTLELQSFIADNLPPYAILSHTWLPDDQEVAFATISAKPANWQDIAGARKIDFLCRQAIQDELNWVWIDTCCIDKSNSVELGEAINSMFNWYQQAEICYVYLIDVQSINDTLFARSRWFSRAWTLQELVAPRTVRFYSFDWALLGTKETLAFLISSKTGIDRKILADPVNMYLQSVACRFSWAAGRQASRIEDVSYSLLGIFGVNMAMQYGEGTAAFKRLQQEILNTTNDQSLFAWGFRPLTLQDALRTQNLGRNCGGDAEENSDSEMERTYVEQMPWHMNGMFADDPSAFDSCGGLFFHHHHTFKSHIAEINGALRIEMLHTSLPKEVARGLGIVGNSYPYPIALLPCGYRGNSTLAVGICLEQWTEGRYRRLEPLAGVFTFLVDCSDIVSTTQDFTWVDNASWIARHVHDVAEAHSFHKNVTLDLDIPMEDYRISMTTQGWTYDEATRTLHRHHNLKNRRRHLEVALHRLKTADYLVIVLQFNNRGDPGHEDHLMGNKVCIVKKSNLSDGPWIENGYAGLLHGQHIGTAASLEGIHVSLKTIQVFNHLISTLKISTNHDAPQHNSTSISPQWPISPIWQAMDQT